LYLSYYHELYEVFTALFEPAVLRYRSPEFLDELQNICQGMWLSGLTELADARLTPAFEALKYQRIAVRSYIGDWVGAWQCLQEQVSGTAPGEPLVEINTQRIPVILRNLSDGSTYQQLLTVLTKYREQQLPGLAVLERIETEWQHLAGGLSTNTVWIPLVENGHGNQGAELINATIQQLKVEVELRRHEAEQDLIFFNNHPMDHNDLIYYQALDAVAVAKRQLRYKPGGRTPFFRVHFGFSDKRYFYTGESFGLGMALAVLAQMEQLTIQRIQHRILKNAIITGGVDVNGQVRGISEHSLPAKLAAFYYSPFTTLVHPTLNQETVQESLTILTTPQMAKLPNLQALKMQPISAMHSVLNNASVTQVKRISLREWSQAHLRKNQILRYVAAILLIAGIGWGSWWLSRDLNPVKLVVKDQYLQVYNKRDKLLWVYHFPFAIKTNNYKSIREDRLIQTFDIDGDGLNEVFMGILATEGDASGAVYCFDYVGRVKWIFNDQPSPPCNAPDLDNFYNAKFVLPYRNENPEYNGILVCLGHHLYYPYRIIKLNKSGELQGEYWHCGQILGLALSSIDSTELVFWGTNNSFNSGMIGTLDINNISGASPGWAKRCDNQLNLGPFKRTYIRFPRPEQFKVSNRDGRPDIRSLVPIGNGQFLAMMFIDKGAILIYTFDDRYRLIAFDFSDRYYGLFREFRGADIFDIYDKQVAWQHFMSIQYWNGKAWSDSSSEDY